ncbi:MAG: amidohydrolase family protein [Actinobacteria bacterium]|nr:amidohydrolase family protein [Actinomycetota bacterium]
MQSVIDIHTHMLSREWMNLLRRHGPPLYEVHPVANGRECIFRGEAPVTVPTPGHFDYELRLRDMDAAGVDLAVVSLTCPNVYWGGREISGLAAATVNDEMAEAQRNHPSRIRWFASLPWEYPDDAVVELRRAHSHGAVGVMVLANIAGQSLTAPQFAPIWAAIDEMELPVLVHPTDPPGVDQMDMRMYDLTWSVGFMFDTTLAIGRMILDGFFDRYTRLKIIASHGGAALPQLVGRFDKGFHVSTLEDRVIQRPPSEYLREIYYDCITYEPASLAHLVSVVGASQVLFGSDYPHIVGDMAGMLANVDRLPSPDAAAIRGQNAERVFTL